MLKQWINGFCKNKKGCIFAPTGEMAEGSNAAVLKTVEGHTSGGSNPSFSAKEIQVLLHLVFFEVNLSLLFVKKLVSMLAEL